MNMHPMRPVVPFTPTVHAPPKPPDIALFRVVAIHDEDAVRELDDTFELGTIFRLAAPWAEPITIAKDGRDLFTLEPTDQGQPARDVTERMRDVIYQSAGHEPPKDVAPLPENEAAARAWAEAARRQMPASPLDVYDGRDRARALQMADRIARSFELTLTLASGLAGTPGTLPKLSLWSGQDAARLADQRRAQAEAVASAEEARAAEAAAAGPVTWRDHGIRAIVVRDRIVEIHGPARVGTQEPRIFAWKTEAGLDVPTKWAENGIEGIDPDEPATVLTEHFVTALPDVDHMPRWIDVVRPIDLDTLKLVRLIRARHFAIDVGPIDRERFSTRGVERVRELARESAKVWLARLPAIAVPGTGYLFQKSLLLERCVEAFS